MGTWVRPASSQPQLSWELAAMHMSAGVALFLLSCSKGAQSLRPASKNASKLVPVAEQFQSQAHVLVPSHSDENHVPNVVYCSPLGRWVLSRAILFCGLLEQVELCAVQCCGGCKPFCSACFTPIKEVSLVVRIGTNIR